MANFKECIEMTLAAEGGYVKDSSDPGGETKYGISKRSYPNLDIRNLTAEQAKAIYKRDFWDKLRLSALANQTLACCVFDTAVNLGCYRAAKMLQEAIVEEGRQIAIDGIIGPQTLGAANSIISQPLGAKRLLIRFIIKRLRYYIDLVEAKPQLGKFLKGWARRAIHPLT